MLVGLSPRIAYASTPADPVADTNSHSKFFIYMSIQVDNFDVSDAIHDLFVMCLMRHAICFDLFLKLYIIYIPVDNMEVADTAGAAGTVEAVDNLRIAEAAGHTATHHISHQNGS